jgi:hypothetical protein
MPTATDLKISIAHFRSAQIPNVNGAVLLKVLNVVRMFDGRVEQTRGVYKVKHHLLFFLFLLPLPSPSTPFPPSPSNIQTSAEGMCELLRCPRNLVMI